MNGSALDPFIRDENGKIIGLVSTGILMPAQENHYRMQFGGEVLKIFDELSGELAGKFVAGDALHTSELVLFSYPVYAGQSYTTSFQVVKIFPGFVLIYGEVKASSIGGSVDRSKDEVVRYSGFAVCAVVNKETGKIVKDGMPDVVFPQNWFPEEYLNIGERFFELQRDYAKLVAKRGRGV